ncbi:MAG: bifunctional pyr operon transcriptional regulator/uracil phosphoribosyltransferase PyrR [Myxococcales bacterium]|nr:bifunctional pyr operon transcriptional regulator/uracil phosphoribosyltransferase PyrR [Myxococcales bacterium]
MAGEERRVLDSDGIARSLRRIAAEIEDQIGASNQLGLVGIRKGGEPLAARIADLIARSDGRSVPVGTVDITLYRDDAASMLPDPEIGPSEIDFDIAGWDVVLVDDVLHTGRTVRAAIDCLLDFGRPRRIWLAALCDRGGRELPVAPDFVGRKLEVSETDIVDVLVGQDGPDRVVVRSAGTPEPASGEGA